MHVPRSRDLRCFRRSHMGALPLSENVVARGLSISRILSKRPSIGVMQEEHANAMTRPIISVYFSYGTILMGSLDVYHIL